jgi:hypothetical protein
MSSPKRNPINISDELQKWVFEMLELGLDCFSAGDYHPFVFLVDEDDGTDMINVTDINGNIHPNLIETAREIVAKACPFATIYIIVSPGYLHKDGTKYDAVVAEAGEKGENEGFVFAQRYLKNWEPGSYEEIGIPAIVNTVANLLSYDS